MSAPAALGATGRFGGAADAVYEILLAAHAGLSDAESDALNARLVLVLAHAVGDPTRVAEAVALAREERLRDPT